MFGVYMCSHHHTTHTPTLPPNPEELGRVFHKSPWRDPMEALGMERIFGRRRENLSKIFAEF
jgi:hypothetical protein